MFHYLYNNNNIHLPWEPTKVLITIYLLYNNICRICCKQQLCHVRNLQPLNLTQTINYMLIFNA